MIIFHRPRHQSIVSIKFHAIYSNNWQIRGWGKNGVWIFMMIKHLQKTKINTCTCPLIFDMVCRKVQVVANIGCQFKIERRIKYIKLGSLFTTHIYNYCKSAKSKGSCHKFQEEGMKTRVQLHDLTGQLAGRRFSSADRRQEVVVVWGLWGKTTYSKSYTVHHV